MKIYAIAEAQPIDALCIAEMDKALKEMVALNIRDYRTGRFGLYSAIEIAKQALELVFEFGVATKSYREAIRTIRVYTQGDAAKAEVLTKAFLLFANAAYSAYVAQKYAADLAPDLVFMEGVAFDQERMRKVFRSAGVKPPDLVPSSAKQTIFLDEGYQPYKDALEGKGSAHLDSKDRMEHWIRQIDRHALRSDGKMLLRASAKQIVPEADMFRVLKSILGAPNLAGTLKKRGFEVEVLCKTVRLEDVFGKK